MQILPVQASKVLFETKTGTHKGVPACSAVLTASCPLSFNNGMVQCVAVVLPRSHIAQDK